MKKRNMLYLCACGIVILSLLLLWIYSKSRSRQLRIETLNRLHAELSEKFRLLTADYETKVEELKNQQAQENALSEMNLSKRLEELSYVIQKSKLEKEKIEVNTSYIHKSDIFVQLKNNPACARNNAEVWSQIENVINSAYPAFSDRLKVFLPKMSPKEWQVALLLKAHLGHQFIADVICETQAGESNIRRRLCKKVFRSELPSSSKFDDFIDSL